MKILKVKMNKNKGPINRILPGISVFAWNGDCSQVAVCPQSKEILIFATNGKPNISEWTLVQVLKEVSLAHISFSTTALFLRSTGTQ